MSRRHISPSVRPVTSVPRTEEVGVVELGFGEGIMAG